MRRIVILAAFILAVSLSATSFAAPINMIGTYSGTVDLATGKEFKSAMVIMEVASQDGTMLLGTVAFPDLDKNKWGSDLKLSGSISGNKLTAMAGKASQSQMILIDGTVKKDAHGNATSISVSMRRFRFDPNSDIAGQAVGVGLLKK